jgi:diphthine-ammonia ligase
VDPPSRACVGVNLSEQSSCHLILDAVAFDDGVDYSKGSTLSPPRLRKVLHVQGRSYWAAANIGPYSQSVHAQERITIAGQIGLLPATLQLAIPPSLEIALSLQHARRVFNATLEGRAEKQRGWIEGCICWIDDLRWLSAARNAWQAQSGNESTVGWEAEWLGAGLTVDDIPVTFVVLPKVALPRSASVEWQLFAHDGQAVPNSNDSDDDDDDDGEASTPTFSAVEDVSFGPFDARWKTIASKKGASAMGIMHLMRSSSNTFSQSTADHLSTALSLKVLYHQQDDLESCECAIQVAAR